MQHLDEGTIHSWLDGALGADESARVERHVAECPQCSAAVREARGFIAASSRILTALDHVPRRVVPVARPVKWHNRPVWRAAAAVVVVAVGSLVVVRNSERTASVAPATPSTPSVTAATATASAKPMAEADSSAKPTTEADFSGKRTADAVRPNAVVRKPALQNDAAVAGGYAVAPSRIAGALAAAPQAAAQGRVAGVTALDVASEQVPLKVVGTQRTIGANVTLYEVTPGDTVTLTELTGMRLEAVVVTGMSSAEALARQSASKSAGAVRTALADTAVLSASDSQRVAEIRAAASVLPAAPALPARVEVVNGVTTISWTDAATGNVLKLSGRMSAAQLKEIKLRIEQERAAAAAARKTP